MKYKQITYEKRVEINILLKTGCSQSKIAEIIKDSKSSVSREIKRNTGLKSYRPKRAHHRALDRRKNAGKHIRSTDEVKMDVHQLFTHDWRPEQIAGWLVAKNKP